MSNPSDPIREKLAEIEAARARVVDACAGVSTTDGARRDEGAWALQDVIEHLVLAERGGFDLIWKAADAHRAGAPRETAPPSATPTGNGTLGLWLAHLRSCDALLETLPAQLDGVPLERVIHPHFLAGPLDALQRPGLHSIPPGPPPGAGPGATAPDRELVTGVLDRSVWSTVAPECSAPRSHVDHLTRA